MSTERPSRIVVAPDSFKGTIGAADAGRAIAAGWRIVRPDDVIIQKPMADGGEGTVDIVAGALSGERHVLEVRGPQGRPVVTSWLRLPDGTALVELASASGLALLDELRPWDADTYGFGQAIAAALDAGASRLLLAIGGSASTDGGAGMLAALGARLSDDLGRNVVPGARGLLDLRAVDLAEWRRPPAGGALVLSDVDNPATGSRGAAAEFGPQKGLTPEDVPVVDAALSRLAGLLGVDERRSGTGAAGATGLALAAWGATTASGAEVVADMIGLEEAVRRADLLITGEGRFDGQTASGKVAEHARRIAERAGVPVALVTGAVDAPVDAFVAVSELRRIAGSVEGAIAEPARWIAAAGEQLAAAFASRAR